MVYDFKEDEGSKAFKWVVFSLFYCLPRINGNLRDLLLELPDIIHEQCKLSEKKKRVMYSLDDFDFVSPCVTFVALWALILLCLRERINSIPDNCIG